MQPTISMPPVVPLAEKTRTDCWTYMDGANLTSADLAYTLYRSQCELIAAGWGISLAELQNW